jgi:hypothetical protein
MKTMVHHIMLVAVVVAHLKLDRTDKVLVLV